MQLGKTLVGAIIGAAVGIAVLIAVQHYKQMDQTWLAIVVAALVGLGVRMMVSTTGHASYARGALTCLLALGAYYGGTQIYSELTTRGILAKKLPDRPPVVQPAAGEGEEGEPAADATTAEADGVAVPVDPDAAQPPATGEPAAEEPAAGEPATQPAPAPRAATLPPRDPANIGPMQPPSPWEYVWLSIAALVAYELGRGSAPAAPKQAVVPPPDAT